MNEINKEIGLRIAASRKNKGMTATELSQRTGFASARISHWEQGRRLPNLESILVLEQQLEVPAAYLLCVDRELYKNPNNLRSSLPLYPIHQALIDPAPATLPIPIGVESEELFAVQLQDNSMSPLFRKNDIVTFHPNKGLGEGSLILFKINKTNHILFRKYGVDNSDIENPVYTFSALDKSIEKITIANQDAFTILGVCNDTIRLFL